MRAVAVLLMLLAASVTALAQERPIVRVEVSPETVKVGEPARLTVTTLVPTFFTRPSVYPSFELANAITRLPADSSYNVRERVGRETWPGIVRTYEVYPLLGATYRLAGQSMEVTYANPGGGDALTAVVEIPEAVIRARVPAGAEALDPYVAGRGLAVSVDVEGDQEDLRVGDALVFTYVAELDGLPAIFIPPLAPALSFEGVSVYADEPDVEDGSPARRREKLTLVFDGGGQFEVPGIAIDFLNTGTGALETASVPGLTVSVAGPPAGTSEVARATRPWWHLVLAAAAVLALVLPARWSIALIAVRYRNAVARHKRSEAFAFAVLCKALKSGNPQASYRAMLTWLGRLGPIADARSFAHEFGDTSFHRGVDGLVRGLYGDTGSAEDLSQLAAGAARARRGYLRQAATASKAGLPPLNP